MSTEVKTQPETTVPASSNGSVPAPSRTSPHPWRQRRYQVSAVAVFVLLVALIGGNNYLGRIYTPEGAVRQYVSALQSGDSGSAWSAIQVGTATGASVSLTDRPAFEAALSSGRPDIQNFAVTSTRSINSTTAAVTVSYDTASGTKDASFVVRRSSRNNLVFYPGWQVVVTPVVLRIIQPAGSGGVLIDGKSVDLGAHNTGVALLPTAHGIRFPGTAVVQPQTITVDLFAGAAQDVVYQATLTSAGVAKATAALKAGFADCVRQTGLQPDGCPQSVASGVVASSGQWQLVGDPTQNLSFGLNSSGNLVASGHFQAVFNYQESGVDGPKHVASAGGYQAILSLAGDDVGVASIKAASGLPAVPRPTAATDQAVEAVVVPALRACASVTSGNPGACPQLFVFPDSSDYHWALLTDPLLDARVSYDSATGLFTVKGDFSMKLNYKIRGYGYTTYSSNTTYLAYVFWDGQQLVLVTIEGQ